MSHAGNPLLAFEEYTTQVEINGHQAMCAHAAPLHGHSHAAKASCFSRFARHLFGWNTWKKPPLPFLSNRLLTNMSV